MSTTTHYGLNKPSGSNLVNPLTDTFPNWDIVDEEMYKNFNLGVSNATESVLQGVHAIVRVEDDLPFFHFTATANFSTGDTFTLDGVSVSAYTPDGLPLKDGAFVSGANILGYFNSSNSSITLMLNTTSGTSVNSSKLDNHPASYFATSSDVGDISDLTTTDKTNVVSAVNELKSDLNATLWSTYASQTGTGELTWAQHFNSIFNSIGQEFNTDWDYRMLVGTRVYTLSSLSSSSAVFTSSKVGSSGTTIYMLTISTSSKYEDATAGTYTDGSSVIVPAGTTIKLQIRTKAVQ